MAGMRPNAAGHDQSQFPATFVCGVCSQNPRQFKATPLKYRRPENLFEPQQDQRNIDIMTTLIGEVRARTVASSHARYFYFYMALSCMAVAFLGFAPTYWLPMATRSLPSMPVIHLHGVLFFAWTLYFAFQTWLAASGRIARHRTIGMIGVSLATAMTIFGFLAAVNIMKRSAALWLADAGVAFAIVPLSGILFFAVAFTLAIANVRQSETHKRLMLLASISLLDAAVARWFLTFLAPPGPAGPPPVEVTILPALVAYLLLVPAVIFDDRKSTRLNSSHVSISYAVFCLKKKKILI